MILLHGHMFYINNKDKLIEWYVVTGIVKQGLDNTLTDSDIKLATEKYIELDNEMKYFNYFYDDDHWNIYWGYLSRRMG